MSAVCAVSLFSVFLLLQLLKCHLRCNRNRYHATYNSIRILHICGVSIVHTYAYHIIQARQYEKVQIYTYVPARIVRVFHLLGMISLLTAVDYLRSSSSSNAGRCLCFDALCLLLFHVKPTTFASSHLLKSMLITEYRVPRLFLRRYVCNVFARASGNNIIIICSRISQ